MNVRCDQMHGGADWAKTLVVRVRVFVLNQTIGPALRSSDKRAGAQEGRPDVCYKPKENEEDEAFRVIVVSRVDRIAMGREKNGGVRLGVKF